MKDLIIFIPVKEKSSRLKNKNFTKIGGISLLERKIKSCKKANIGKVVVSTNSKRIQTLSIKYGVDEVNLRPGKYATSKSTLISVILDYLRNEIKNKKTLKKYIALLPLTNPFLKIQTIKKSYKQIKYNKNLNSIVSVVESNLHPFLFVELKKKIKFDIYKIKKNGFNSFNRSQDRPKSYITSAAIRITKTKYFMKYLNNKNPYFSEKPFDRKNSLPIKISLKESHDINTKFDLEMAKILNHF